jgi:hypothetical protein
VCVFQLLANFPNSPNVVQLLGLSASTSSLPVDASASCTAAGDGVQCKSSVAATSAVSCQQQKQSTAAAVTSNNNTNPGLLTDSLRALKPALIARLDTGAGDAAPAHLLLGDPVVDDSTTTCCHHAFQPGGRLLVGGGDDVDVSTIALLSDHTTEAQLHDLFLQQQQQQQQWQLHLGHMMQLDVSGQQQQPLIIGADTAALLWHQQQQVAAAGGSEQLVQQQLLLQQQALAGSGYEAQQLPASSAAEGQQLQSPRQKNRQFARGRV